MAGLPGFKAVCSTVAGLFVILAVSMLLQGERVMAGYGVPPELIASPYYADFFRFTFVHMIVIGVLIGTLGRYVEQVRMQRVTSRLLCLVSLVYAALDLHSSDSPLGQALYRGPRSLAPAVIDVLVALAFAYLSFGPLDTRQPVATAQG